MANVTVVGGGICGIASAYFLSKRGYSCTLVERSKPFNAASGRAGGFLAKDWSDGTPSESLTHASFQLHFQLAHELGAERTGFRELNHAVATQSHEQLKHASASIDPDAPSYVRNCTSCMCISNPHTIAQTHPARLCRAMLEESDTSIVNATATGVERDARTGRVQRVLLDNGNSLDVQRALVLAMGPWTDAVRKWFADELGDLDPIVGNKAHSITVNASVEPTPVFSSIIDENGQRWEPEAYPRAEEVYVCGQHSNTPLPSDPDAIKPEEDMIERLKHSASLLSDRLADKSAITSESACYLPICSDGPPLLGAIPESDNTAFIATGGSCWGILNGPGMGKAISELIADGEAHCANIESLKPENRVRRKRARRKKGKASSVPM